MSPSSRRVTASFALSALAHLLFFTALALISDLQPATAKPEPKPPEKPLEIILHTTAAATPKPKPSPKSAPPDALAKLKAAQTPPPVAIRPRELVHVELDPENLKPSEKAPEGATLIAAHNSVATEPKSSAAAPPLPSVPQKAAEADLAAQEQELVKNAEASAASEPLLRPKPTPIPLLHPVPPSSVFRTSMARPTPVGMQPSSPPAKVLAQQRQTPAGAPEIKPARQSAPSPRNGTGINAVGSYTKAVLNALAVTWFQFQQTKLELMSAGEVVIEFEIDEKGKVSDVQVISNNTGNAANGRYAVRAVREAEFPPLPPDILARLPADRKRLKQNKSFIVDPPL